ncbi:23S rRNA (cytosine1962-C5)-methyltransferase [Granulicatella balaenopterae]|uniref:23S rRNA (Cytosine1962-C5)-methyltransferase n=1 Tax=Granulicatella balaenopterae TaxID=137733 RepID=A0A1H9M6I6_9LACT|nr:class I SAM-dependent rRNA methyltransferase [Granulicatella balaenopterae]SER19316.1 23S rRNA (cytosine1962-C5)-methyltransferase [Granulicatella balaenopterae]
MKQLMVRRRAASQIRKGSPLIRIDDLAQEPICNEGDIVSVVDERQQFLGTAYVGTQNKGIAWIFSKDKNATLTEEFFQDLFHHAIDHRQSLLNDEATNAFRLFNGEGDGFGGVTIDSYDGYLVFSWYSEGIYIYRELIMTACLHSVDGIKGIYEKVRFQSDLEISRFVGGQEAPEPLMVKENNVQYATYLNEGLMTGIFLDQRDVRRLLMENYSAGKTVLNTFSYTGAFSVASAMGGATHTTSVDVAKRSLSKTREQFTVNGLEAEDQKIYVMDVFEYIKYANRKELDFDIVVVDPPSFARTKKRTFSVAKDYPTLVEELVPLVKCGGILVLSTNAANVTTKEFDRMIEEGIQPSGRNYRILHKLGLPEDFPSAPHTPVSDYLKVRFIQLDK